MQTNRRSFIKMLTYGALAYTAGGPGVESLMAACTPSGSVCILLHGLFFMGFKGNNLIVATPQFGGHEFKFREQGKPFGQFPPGGQNIDLSLPSSGLVDNANTKTFPPNIPQFSASKTGVGEFMPAGKHAHEFQLILPRPDEIHGFRKSHLGNFINVTESGHPKPNGLEPMQENIISNCGGKGHPEAPLALLIGLVFTKTAAWKFKNVVSFYAEHHKSCDLTDVDVNAALDQAKHLFENDQNFDLRYALPPPPSSTPTPSPAPSPTPAAGVDCPPCDSFGVTRNDLFSIEEIDLNACCATKGPNPINCAQFGVNP